ALEEMKMRQQVQLVVSGGIRTGADVAKALALGADAVAIGQGVLFALGCNRPSYRLSQSDTAHDVTADYAHLGTSPGACHHCHTGRCPVGITTQDQVLEQRLTPDEGARRLENYLRVLTMELATLARACGKSD